MATATVSFEEFEEYIRKLIRSGDVEGAAREIQNARLNEEELNQLFAWLNTDGYDAKTGKWKLSETNNAAFLDLVNQVKKKLEDGNK